jgi:hypothetical protein
MKIKNQRRINPILLQGLHNILKISLGDIDGSNSFLVLGGGSLVAIQLATYCQEHQFSVLVRDLLQCRRLNEIEKQSSYDELYFNASHPRPTPSPNPHKVLRFKDLHPTTLKSALQQKLGLNMIESKDLLQDVPLTEM